ncbi:unnamed protein product [Ambrosiozyma monospora]|uniref:Unnamed protein product n=1 Tax=Ambrosiozyma monospora TaxID=43982 RepID=A0ACB5SQR3_AMBMO|nr:unnamed protein product [Ambrosiozyma monospora]
MNQHTNQDTELNRTNTMKSTLKKVTSRPWTSSSSSTTPSCSDTYNTELTTNKNTRRSTLSSSLISDGSSIDSYQDDSYSMSNSTTSSSPTSITSSNSLPHRVTSKIKNSCKYCSRCRRSKNSGEPVSFSSSSASSSKTSTSVHSKCNSGSQDTIDAKTLLTATSQFRLDVTNPQKVCYKGCQTNFVILVDSLEQLEMYKQETSSTANIPLCDVLFSFEVYKPIDGTSANILNLRSATKSSKVKDLFRGNRADKWCLTPASKEDITVEFGEFKNLESEILPVILCNGYLC